MVKTMTFLRFSFFSICMLMANSTVSLADTDAEDDDVDEITKGLKEKAVISQPVTLYRLSEDEKTKVTYTDELTFSSGGYDLRHTLARKRTHACACAAAKDGYKSHVIAGSVRTYKGEQNEPRTDHPLFTTALKFPFSPSKSQSIIDWASNQSKSENTDKIYRRFATSGNGHSEPQLLDDLEALFIKDAPALVKYFIPPEKDQELWMGGLELYGSFDMCDSCLQALVDFRKKHQRGQTSIAQAIQDKIGSDKTKKDAFPILYHSYYPYKDATYRAEDEESYYDRFAYTYSTSPSRADTFRNNAYEESHTLSQATKVPVRKGEVYAHIHHLSGKKAAYSAKNQSFTFK